MTSTFVPYSKRAPKTDNLQELRAELERVRDVYGHGSECAEAFSRLLRASCKQGRPIDSLDQRNPNEVERFFENVLNGVDGHAYWGPVGRDFIRNDGKGRSPRRWWWVYLNGDISQYDDLVPSCGEKNCIAPAHQMKGRGIVRMRYTPEQVIGTIQVAAMRLGRAPLASEWDAMRLRPGSAIVVYRLNAKSWAEAMRRAGIEPTNIAGARGLNAETARRAVIAASDLVGHPVGADEFRSPEVNAHLKKLNLPVTPNSIKKYMGPTWADALRACGYTLPPHRDVSRLDHKSSSAAIREATRVLGHEPRYTEFQTPEMKAHLKSLGLPVSVKAIRRAIGPTWNDVIKNARPTKRARLRGRSR